jgi:hypothetical protein
MTEGAWTARGLWLPTLRFDYLKSNTSTSSVIHFEMLRPSARPDGVYTPDEGWCTWSFAYGPATFEWSDQPRGFELNWELFPFGQQRMRLGMQCTDELVDCSLFDLHMSQGRAPQPQNGTAPSERRLAQAQRRAASGAAATTYLRASSSLAVPRTFPLVEHLSTPANTPSPDVNLERTPVRFEMTIVMSRQPLTYVLRLIVPMVLVGFLALLTFFVKENYTQVRAVTPRHDAWCGSGSVERQHMEFAPLRCCVCLRAARAMLHGAAAARATRHRGQGLYAGSRDRSDLAGCVRHHQHLHHGRDNTDVPLHYWCAPHGNHA